MKRTIALTLILSAACFGLAACGGDDNDGGSSSGSVEFKVPDEPIADTIGAGEGKLNIVNWAGYAEDGSTDKNYDWVTPFEKDTGCQVSSKVASTSDEMVTLMRTGRYDGVSASGNASVRLIAGGDVRPVDTKILTAWPNIDPHLKNQPYNSVDGQMYGAPHGYGAQLLAYNTKNITPAPDSWSVVYDDANKGKVTVYDDPITIADAALYLSKTQTALGITNPYELDAEAVRRSRRSDEEAAAARRAVLGRRRQAAAGLRAGRPRRRARSGSTPPTCWKPTSSRSRRCSRRRARPAGRTRGCCPRRRSTRTACSSG